MDTQKRLTEWLRNMGYDGNIPETMDHICNSSTHVVWELLMQNAKPKQEVDHTKGNIIIKRLKEKPLHKQDEFGYPIEEIEVYRRKLKFENQISTLKTNIEEKDNTINHLSKNNKINYMLIDNTKAKIKQNEEREFVLNAKCETLQEQINWAEESLATAKSLTPIEMNEHCNINDITATLQQCAEKLESILREVPIQKKSNLQSSIRKSAKKQFTFDRYLNSSQRKGVNESLRSTPERTACKRSQLSASENKENVRALRKSLFASNEPVLNTNLKKTKRESLGILPESCYGMEDDDNFLSSDPFASVPKSLFPDTPDRVVSSHNFQSDFCAISPAAKIILTDFDMDRQSSTAEYRSVNHINGGDNYTKKLLYENAYSNKFVTDCLQQLLCTHNRHFIWKSFQSLHDVLISDINDIIFECSKNESNPKLSKDDIAKLQFVHVQTEIHSIGHKRNIEQLMQKIIKRKNAIFSDMVSKKIDSDRIEKQKQKLELILEDVGLDAALTCMKKEMNIVPRQDNNNELLLTLNKICSVKDSISCKINAIDDYIENINNVLQSICGTREETTACVHRLNIFFDDLAWASPLTQNLLSTEVKIFKKYPLEYTRKFAFTDRSTYFRDICTRTVPFDADLNAESLYMISGIIESPFSPPENVLVNVLRDKIKLNTLKSLRCISEVETVQKYLLSDLQSQENYVQLILDKLSTITYSTSSNKILSSTSVTKDIMDLWLDMPFRNSISSDRLVDGHNYQYYEKMYDNFYNSL